MAESRKDKEEQPEATSTEALQAEIAALRADMSELGSLVSGIGKRRAAGLKAAAGTAAREGAAKGEAALDEIVGELQSLEEEIEGIARRRPMASLGLAAFLGFLFGLAFRR